MRKLLLMLCGVFAGISQFALADTPKMVRRLTIDDGLSQSTVHAIYQAHDGQMWFATGDGISIFNGEDFTYLYRGDSSENGLQDNYVFGLREDPAGRIWVGTLGGGASVYSQSAQFLAGFHAARDAAQSALLNDVYDFAFPTDGSVWVATGDGVLHLSAQEVEATLTATPGSKTGTKQPQLFPDVTNPTAAIRLLILKDGRILVGTQAQGLLLLDAQGQNPRPIRSDNSNLSGDRIMDLFADDQGRVWVATEDGGLNMLNPASLTVSQPIKLPDSDVESIAQSQDGRLWFGTWSNGIFVHDPRTGKTVNHRAHPAQSQRLSSNSVIALTAGRTGRIWAGTYDNGANSLSQFPDPFETYFADPSGTSGPNSAVVWSLADGGNRDLWVGSKGGLNRLLRDERRFERVDLGDGAQDVRAILNLGDRLLLAIRGRGLFAYEPDGQRLTPILDASGNPMFHDLFIRLLMRDQKGQIWVGTHSGTYLLDQDLNEIRHFRKDSGALPHDRTRSLYEDPNGIIWIGTSGGLTRFDPQKNEINNYSGPAYFRDNDVRAVYCLPDGRLLVGTQAGVSILSKRMELLEQIGHKDGLPNETIYSLMPSQNGHIWITTNNGLVQFVPDTGAISVFRSRDGLQAAEFNFNAHTQLQDGTLAVGGVNGLSLFQPGVIHAPLLPPVVSYEQITTGATPHTSALATELVAPAEWTLDITVAHFTDPTANRLRWRLDPVDTDWQNATGTQHRIRRENLLPGQYTLHFQGIGSDGATSPEHALSFHVAPPVHLRWYAILFYLTCLLGLVLSILRLRTRSLRQRTADLEQMVDEKTRALVAADEERSRFYARAAHEIRTPVSLIKAPLQSIEKTADLDVRNHGLLALVLRAVDRLVRLTDEMSEVAEHRRGVATKQISIDLPGVIDPIMALYRDSATLHHLKFNASVAPLGAATLDLEALELILHNLLSNAVRHTPTGGAISVKIALINQMFEVTISNQGTLPEQTIENLRGTQGSGPVLPIRGSEIVGAMVQRSGAEIRIEADPARISLRMPARHQTTPAPGPQPVAPRKDGSSAQILIVEDDRELRHYLSDALSEIGQIRAVASCASARRAFQNAALNLVICDVMLPDGSGFDLIREMKEAPETSHIPAVFLTALSDDPSIKEGVAAWGDDYVTKPFDIDSLLSKVRLRLRNSEAIRSHMRRQIDLRDADTTPPEDLPIMAPADTRLLAQIEQHLADHLSNTGFSIDDLAQLCAVSKRNLQRKLSALYGLSFSQLLSQRRVEHAAKLLNSGMSVKETCQACGYTHPSSFARRFKQTWGVQPSEYRQKA